MAGCRHRCCAIRSNPYHSHVDPPEGCRRCRVADVERLGFEVDELVDAVLATLTPEIPGLPRGEPLAELVLAHAADVCLAAQDDPQLEHLDPEQRRTVLAGRVAVALAYPPVAPAV
jgi:hypothetical protein